MSADDEALFFLRFAEWRPQTLSAEVTIEIPPVIQYITENSLNSLDFHCWIELTSLTKKNAEHISRHIDQLLVVGLTVAQETYKKFPPRANSFNLIVHLISWHGNEKLTERRFSWKIEELLQIRGRRLSLDLLKIINETYKENSSNDTWDASRWGINKFLKYLNAQVEITNERFSYGENVHLIYIAGWNTEENLDINKLDDNYALKQCFSFNKGYLFYLASKTSFLNQLEEIYKFDSIGILETVFEQYSDEWESFLLDIIEPTLVVTLTPNTLWRSNYTIATNLSFSQHFTLNEHEIIFKNIRSLRYPIIINFLFYLPIESMESLANLEPIVWEMIELKLEGIELISSDQMGAVTAFKLPLANPKYQAEREINERIRLNHNLQQKIRNLMKEISSRSLTINEWISQSDFQSEEENALLFPFIDQGLSDLDLAFQIIDWLSEDELLLSEIPSTKKNFLPKP